MRVLHLVDRVSVRGGAYQHLRAILDLSSDHELLVAGGAREPDARLPCPVIVCAGLDSRERRAAALDPITASFRPDVVHLHTIVNPAVLEWAADRPAVLTAQDHRYFCPGRGKWTLAGEVCREPMSAALCRACFEDAGYFDNVFNQTRERLAALKRLRVVVLSEYMKRELEAVGVDGARIRVIPPFIHGLHLDALPDGPSCVLFAGRLAEAKGAWDAVDAWRRSGVDLPLVFAGSGPLRSRIEETGLEVLGWIPHERLAAVYRRARALLMPPRWQEPFGIAGLEAQIMGVPVAAWLSGGIHEWHSCGPLTPWGDVDALALRLREAIDERAQGYRGFAPEELMRRLFLLYRETAS